MNQHPMTKAYVAAFVKNGGAKFKNKFNMFAMDQTILFGYRRFDFRVMSVRCVPSWDTGFMPLGVTSLDELVMIQSPSFGEWLACDADAKADYAEFVAIMAKTIGVRKD